MAFRPEIVRQVKESYENKRAEAAAAADSRRREAEEAIPRLAEIHRELSATASRVMGAALSGDSRWEEAFRQIRDRNLALQKERAELLTENGYPADYTSVRYSCDICQDTGWVGSRMCVCMRRAISLLEYEKSGLSALMKTQSFDSFDLSYYQGMDRVSMARNAELLRRFAEDFSQDTADSWLLLGGTGLGKTHLSTSVAKVVIDKGFSVTYLSAQDLISVFERSRGTSEREELADLTDCDLLIIDDLGTELTNNYTVSCIYSVINTRITAGKSTLVSTNLTQEELRSRYADRITSRLFGEYKPLLFSGRDIRAQRIGRSVRT